MKKLISSLLVSCLLSVFVLNTQTANAHDFKVKGFHIDLRTEIMTMPALKAFAKQLQEIGVNTILMEYEASFPYEKHFTISSQYAYTRDEIKDFVKYCDGLGIEVIPMQQNFGHTDYILRHARYSKLAESQKDVTQVCPLKTKGCVELFDELFADMMSLHPSKYFHIGGDETRLLGVCPKCAAKVAKEGKSKLFVDYMKEMCKLVIKHGKTPIMWADIILKYPESISDLPKETIFVDWNYGWKNSKFGDAEALVKKGIKFWGAPAIRSAPDNQYLTTWVKHFDNQKVFIPYSRQQKYDGIVMTSWSTSGVFSTVWEVGNEVIEMLPIRYVYPMNGFNVLIYMYGKAINQKEPIDPEKVVIEYAQEKLGLSAEEGKTIYDLLMIPQTAFSRAVPTVDHNKKRQTHDQIIADMDMAIAKLSAMKPKANKTDIEHFKMMFNIRKNYTAFKKLEKDINGTKASKAQAKEYLKRMETIIKAEEQNSKQFAKLQKGYIYDDEIKEINRVRTHKMYDTYKRLKAAAR